MFGADAILFRDLKAHAADIFHKNLPARGEVMTKRSVKIE
jgi:hypothetical protein